MAKANFNVIPLRRSAVRDQMMDSGNVIRFPDRVAAARRFGRGGANGSGNKIARRDSLKSVIIALVVLGADYWFSWIAGFSFGLSVAVAATAVFLGSVVWANIGRFNHYILYVFMIMVITSYINLPFMLATAIMAGLLIWARGIVMGRFL